MINAIRRRDRIPDGAVPVFIYCGQAESGTRLSLPNYGCHKE